MISGGYKFLNSFKLAQNYIRSEISRESLSGRVYAVTNERLKINESRYIALFVVSGSIKKLFSIDYVNIYLF